MADGLSSVLDLCFNTILAFFKLAWANSLMQLFLSLCILVVVIRLYKYLQ